MLKVALTHDVDRTIKSYQCLTHAIKSIGSGNLKKAAYHLLSWKKRKEVYWNIDKIIEIEQKYNVKSTFFFLNESFPFKLYKPSSWKLALGRYDINEKKITETIKYLDSNGWEIGLHGSFESYKNLRLLRKEKVSIEKILEHEVYGIRQHYLNLTDYTWKIQHTIGFKYDSSWGYTRNIGYKDNKIEPFKPISNNFIVFPLAIMDSCYMNKINRLDSLRNIIDKTIENDAILVVNWHTNKFNEKEFPGFKSAYVDLIEEFLKWGASFDTLINYYNRIPSRLN